MIRSKVDDCFDNLIKNHHRVISVKTKYIDNFGFASVYFKVMKGLTDSIIHVIILPDEFEDAEDYSLFRDFMRGTGLDKYFIKDLVIDYESISSLLKFNEHERLKYSGKKALHLDLSERSYIDSVKSVVAEYLEPFNLSGCVKCVFDDKTKELKVYEIDLG